MVTKYVILFLLVWGVSSIKTILYYLKENKKGRLLYPYILKRKIRGNVALAVIFFCITVFLGSILSQDYAHKKISTWGGGWEMLASMPLANFSSNGQYYRIDHSKETMTDDRGYQKTGDVYNYYTKDRFGTITQNQLFSFDKGGHFQEITMKEKDVSEGRLLFFQKKERIEYQDTVDLKNPPWWHFPFPSWEWAFQDKKGATMTKYEFIIPPGSLAPPACAP